jgi:hypothetical protein
MPLSTSGRTFRTVFSWNQGQETRNSWSQGSRRLDFDYSTKAQRPGWKFPHKIEECLDTEGKNTTYWKYHILRIKWDFLWSCDIRFRFYKRESEGRNFLNTLYISTYIRTYQHIYKPTFRHIHTTYIPTCMHTYTYRHTNIRWLPREHHRIQQNYLKRQP